MCRGGRGKKFNFNKWGRGTAGPSGGVRRLIRGGGSELSCLWGKSAGQPTPVLLLGKSHGRKTLVGYSLWGRKESDTTERLYFHFPLSCTGEGNGSSLRILTWRIPGTEEPGRLPSTGSHRVRHY